MPGKAERLQRRRVGIDAVVGSWTIGPEEDGKVDHRRSASISRWIWAAADWADAGAPVEARQA
jgi:hypothetical protein